jgi:hypothetical protein
VFPDDVEEEEAVAKDGTVVDLGDGVGDPSAPSWKWFPTELKSTHVICLV